jgi:DNA-binding beta-propeller fold protein YncE
MTSSIRKSLFSIAGAAALALAAVLPLRARAAEPGLLPTLHRHITLASMVTAKGDFNPYAVLVAPVSAGKIHKDDVLVTDFNNVSNLQGTGSTIVRFDPATRKVSVFASLPQHLKQCPGGLGFSTAMTMLETGWVIVGSTPSTDGTTNTMGAGCLLVLSPEGELVSTWTGPKISDPWGNMAVIDQGTRATLFVSMSGFGVPGPTDIDPKTGYPKVVHKATVLRIELSIPKGKAPVITHETVIANGFGQRADRSAFLIGPTGLVLGSDGTLYASDALGNRIAAIANAATRTASAGLGRTVTENGLLTRPLAMCVTPQGHLLVINATHGDVVELDPTSGRQLYAQWLDVDQAQSPPGNGDLFGIAMTPDGKGFYYVEDDVNTLMEAMP